MSDITRITVKREFCLRFIATFKKLIHESEDDATVIPSVRTQLTHLSERTAAFEEHHAQILTHPDYKSKREELWEQYDAFHADVLYIETICNAPPFKVIECVDQSTILNTAFNTSNSSNSGAYARLPKLNLPTFDGTISDWSSYYDIYVSSVHVNDTLHPVQKFQYLKSTLKGEPLLLIKSIPLTDTNYDIALDMLKARYARPRLISACHLKSIISLPNLNQMSYEKVSHFVTSVNEHVAALRAQNEPVDAWSRVLTFILVDKLETEVRNKFEETLDPIHLPDLTQLLRFLETYISAQQWQTINQAQSPSASPMNRTTSNIRDRSQQQYVRNKRKTTFVSTLKPKIKCVVCSQPHPLYQCEEFKTCSIQQRIDKVRTHRCCSNCLSPHHRSSECPSFGRCRTCQRKHHSLLHLPTVSNYSSGDTIGEPQDPATVPESPMHPSPKVMVTTNTPLEDPQSPSVVLLSTAVVRIADKGGNWHEIRVLLDNASETSLMTNRCRRKLNLPLHPTNTTLSGVSKVEVGAVKGTVQCKISSRSCDDIILIAAAVLQDITHHLPHQHISKHLCPDVSNLYLADPNFNIPGSIDMLIGADMYYSVITGSLCKLSGRAHAIGTMFGWVISGPLDFPQQKRIQTCVTTKRDDLSDTLRRFWEIEEIESTPTCSENDKLAEQLFQDLHYRTPTGRYSVPMLFKDYPPILGTSFGAALACFRSLRNRLLHNDPLRIEYIAFMEEYENAGHMTKLSSTFSNQSDGYFIPHHCVYKSDKLGAKLRVVFNASKISSNGKSLNDELLTGPALQVDLANIVMRQRLHPVIFTADIKQMYRQVLVPQKHRTYQKILWNSDFSSSPHIYQLNTVTYGTTSAPFLAMRTLKQLVNDEGAEYPEAARVLTADTFVDDIITGSETIQMASILKSQLVDLLSTAGMELRKWSSNCSSLLQDIPDCHKQTSILDLDPDHTIKILGLMWNPTTDTFLYRIHIPESKLTKRKILSEAARIFDPLGWLSPTTIVAKQLIQQLWIMGIDWDASLPISICDKWQNYKSQLPQLRDVVIPRLINTRSCHVDLLGFCDASEKSYAAVVYIRSQHQSAVPVISLVTAKTKVSPVKQISLPRLELCSALLLSLLIDKVVNNHPIKFKNIYLWSDSTVALSWIRAPSSQWKTFVANRVSQIQGLTNKNSWHHVRSRDNPADCASRGILPAELPQHNLWWTGPRWLLHPVADWPLTTNLETLTLDTSALGEERPKTCLLNQENDPGQIEIFTRYSSLDKLVRITARCLRFGNICRRLLDTQSTHLTAAELNQSLLILAKCVQENTFPEEIKQIQRGQQVRNKSLRKLNPFLDGIGMLRVGGRLRHSSETFDKKHPILLPSNHLFTKLVITQYHERYLHPAPRTLQGILERKFWILAARRIIRQISSKCIKCFRCNPQFRYPMMGDLPTHRVTQLKPFEALGVDYGGPFHITPHKGRGYKSLKAYLCLFICFSTKAVHLEAVSDLSTEAFLAAFRRFLARRGRCSHIYSDAGTNFIGAKTYFTDLQRFIASTSYNDYLSNKLATNGIEWHVNPPAAPHFGGLWEAGIKSVKFHLARTIGLQILTFEELATVFCEIEAILNSRPLCPSSSDPNDVDALTPSHFLTLEPAVSLPEPDLTAEPMNRLSRWQLLQRLSQDFWKRWRHEYLNTLQQRHKWIEQDIPLQQGHLVLIKDNNLPPLQWRLGRVVKVSPGPDRTIRVATVQTTRGMITRPVVKLAPLPMDPDPEVPV